MLAAVTGRAVKKPRGEAGVRIQSRQQIVSEACPESEFSLNPGAASTGEGGGVGAEMGRTCCVGFQAGLQLSMLCQRMGRGVCSCRSLPGCA